MEQYEATYKLGNGEKERKKVVEAENRKEASLQLLEALPKNSYIIQFKEVERIKPKRISHYKGKIHNKMIIENVFEKFVFDILNTKKLNNQMLVDYLKTNLNTWKKLRSNPEKFYFYDLIRLREFLDVPLKDIIEKMNLVMEENIKKGTLLFK